MPVFGKALLMLLSLSLTQTAAAANVRENPDFYQAFQVAAMREEGYPEELLDFMVKYPQTAQYVLEYPKYRDVHEPVDISGDVKEGEIPLFLQWDKRWGYEQYGTNLMGINGCGPTCLSMVYCGLTGETDWDPWRVAQMAEEKGFYVNGIGTAWSLMSTGAGVLGLKASGLPKNAEALKNALESGQPVICSMSPGDFTYKGHFIVLTGLNARGKVLVNDPNSPENSRKKWDLDVLLKQMKGAWSYQLVQ